MTELLTLLYSDAQTSATYQDQPHLHEPFLKADYPTQQRIPSVDKPAKSPTVSPSEAISLLVKYHQAVEMIKKHKQQQQQATQNLLTLLQQYLVSKD